jgi:hypothetical protein
MFNTGAASLPLLSYFGAMGWLENDLRNADRTFSGWLTGLKGLIIEHLNFSLMSDYYSMRRREMPKPEKTYDLADDPETLTRQAILILEDDVVLALQLKEALEIQGYAVTVASNGAEGLKKSWPPISASFFATW